MPGNGDGMCCFSVPASMHSLLAPSATSLYCFAGRTHSGQRRPDCETASVIGYQGYGVLCWKRVRALDKFSFVFIFSYASMEGPMDQQQVMRITKALADP